MTKLKDDSDFMTVKHIAGIGSVAVQWAFMEEWLKAVARALCKADRGYGYILTNHMPVQTLIDTIRTMGWFAFADEEAEFDTLMDQIKAAYAKRNILIHSVWEPGSRPDSIRPRNVRTRGAFRTIETEFTPREMAALGIEICRLGLRLLHFVRDRGYPVEPLPEKETKPDP